MNELYPLKFRPQFKKKIWGGSKIHFFLKKAYAPSVECGESWEISAVQNNISVVKNGFLKGNSLQEIVETYLGDVVGDKIYQRFGIEFPLLVKFIDATQNLSLQVHPNDKVAKERHNAYGKTELWYILHSDEHSELICGFRKPSNTKEFLSILHETDETDSDKTLRKLLHYEEVSEGEVFYIPAGRVHALLRGVLLLEIQQTSDITYRIYDWGRTERELHTNFALDVLDYQVHNDYKIPYSQEKNKRTSILKCEYFSVQMLDFDEIFEADYNFLDSFVIYVCVSGRCEISYGNDEPETFKAGETILIPAVLKNLHLIPQTNCRLLEVFIE